jgi:ribonuclease BN (tRNA processing enzyme)
MKLIILGSGTYQPELERRSAAYLIQTADQNICFDFGRGAIEQLLKVGVHVNQLDALFITHWHGDHVNDLVTLLHIITAPPADHGLWPIRIKPLKIYGPEGTLENLKTIVSIIRYGEKSLDNIEVKEISEDKIEGEGWTIYSYPTIHNEGMKPLCYRLEAEGKVFAYSGDTVESDGLAKAIKNADLAIVEAAWPDEVQPKTHFTGVRAGKFAQENGVKKLVITHMAPLYMQKYEPKADAEKEFKGEVILAKDLLKIKL